MAVALGQLPALMLALQCGRGTGSRRRAPWLRRTDSARKLRLLKQRITRRCLGGPCEIDLMDIRTIDNFVKLQRKSFASGCDAAATATLPSHDIGLPRYLSDLRVTCLSRAMEGSLD